MPPIRGAKPNARAELQAWYLDSLLPKVARAADRGVVTLGAADALDRQVRDFLDLPSGAAAKAA